MEIAAILVAAVGLTGAIVKYLTTIASVQKKTQEQLTEIHVMVNSRMDEALKRIDQLLEALADAGIDVPDKPA